MNEKSLNIINNIDKYYKKDINLKENVIMPILSLDIDKIKFIKYYKNKNM